ncbi:MAG: DUF3017 domain-containing protein [Candidatus Nanopelagicales bacterium]|jgi:hypothetical protein|nr:DUF3017 domain-containing protein [Candidatus Nanopelagicales bacterium]
MAEPVPLPEERDPFYADRVEEDAALAIEEARGAEGPRYQWPTVLVLSGLVLSLGIVAADHFRRGAVLFAAFVMLAFFLRMLLEDSGAGWLAVRSRAVDLACLGFLAIGLSILALVVPPPS